MCNLSGSGGFSFRLMGGRSPAAPAFASRNADEGESLLSLPDAPPPPSINAGIGGAVIITAEGPMLMPEYPPATFLSKGSGVVGNGESGSEKGEC